MAQNFLTHINLNKNELRMAVIQPLAVAPSAPREGLIYYSTVDHTIYQWNGSTWFPLDATKLAGVIPLSALDTDPLDRANHTGTQTTDTISNLESTVKGYSISDFAMANGNINMNGYNILGLLDPVNDNDAATKYYVDLSVQAAKAGIDSKPSVRVLAQSDVSLSGLQIIDDVSLNENDRILLAGQADPIENGSYIVHSGAWVRTDDTITSGSFWYVEEGTDAGGSSWIVQSLEQIAVGSSPIIIGQFLAAAVFTAGDGINLVGNEFSVKYGTGLSITSGFLVIDPTIVVTKYSETIGDGGTTAYLITHNLNSEDVVVSIKDTSTNEHVFVDIIINDANSLYISFAEAPGISSYRVTIHA